MAAFAVPVKLKMEIRSIEIVKMYFFIRLKYANRAIWATNIFIKNALCVLFDINKIAIILMLNVSCR